MLSCGGGQGDAVWYCCYAGLRAVVRRGWNAGRRVIVMRFIFFLRFHKVREAAYREVVGMQKGSVRWNQQAASPLLKCGGGRVGGRSEMKKKKTKCLA